MHKFTLLIQGWYRQNFRDLPWRRTTDPYLIWLSEVILQQTRVSQGLSYYNNFLKNYPNVEALANADENEVLKLWQGLGYYSRARNLHFAAQQIVDDFGGTFPENYKDIKSLKGVGDYTAAAIASFAYGLPYAVLDGNVYRVLSRYFNDDTPIDTGAGKKVFTEYAQLLLDKNDPATHNQAIMELGALVCKPANPDCMNCPLQESCEAFQAKTQHLLPVKSKRIQKTNRYLNYLVHISDSSTIQLVKREGDDIWKNMFQFPLIEVGSAMKVTDTKKKINDTYGLKSIKKITSVKHILTHQNLYVTFWKVEEPIENDDVFNVDKEGLKDFPLPRVIDKFIEEFEDLIF